MKVLMLLALSVLAGCAPFIRKDSAGCKTTNFFWLYYNRECPVDQSTR